MVFKGVNDQAFSRVHSKLLPVNELVAKTGANKAELKIVVVVGNRFDLGADCVQVLVDEKGKMEPVYTNRNLQRKGIFKQWHSRKPHSKEKLTIDIIAHIRTD